MHGAHSFRKRSAPLLIDAVVIQRIIGIQPATLANPNCNIIKARASIRISVWTIKDKLALVRDYVVVQQIHFGI